MNREEYIEMLIEQGYTDQQIEKMLEEKFPDPFATVKKTSDPSKKETSLGSLKDMVFKQEDGSSESQSVDYKSFMPFIGEWEEDKDKFNKIGKDFGYWNEKLDRVLKVELNEKESEAISLIESEDRGEGEYGKDLFRRYKENEKEV